MHTDRAAPGRARCRSWSPTTGDHRPADRLLVPAGTRAADLLRAGRPHPPGHAARRAPDRRRRGPQPGARRCAPTSRAGCSSGTASWRTTPGSWSRSRAPPPPTAPASCTRVQRRSAAAAIPRGCATSSPASELTVSARAVVNATGVWAEHAGRDSRRWHARSRRYGPRRAPTSCCARPRSATRRPP